MVNQFDRQMADDLCEEFAAFMKKNLNIDNITIDYTTAPIQADPCAECGSCEPMVDEMAAQMARLITDTYDDLRKRGYSRPNARAFAIEAVKAVID